MRVVTSPSNFALLFFFNDTATTKIYTLSLHDALPICPRGDRDREARAAAVPLHDARPAEDRGGVPRRARRLPGRPAARRLADWKSIRLNPSHANISYGVFCLKKKNFLASTLSGLFSVI